MVVRVIPMLKPGTRNDHTHIGGRYKFYVERFNVTAYSTKKRKKDGALIYYKDHDILNCVPWSEVVSRGYEKTPLRSLHNRLVEEEVLAQLGFSKD